MRHCKQCGREVPEGFSLTGGLCDGCRPDSGLVKKNWDNLRKIVAGECRAEDRRESQGEGEADGDD